VQLKETRVEVFDITKVRRWEKKMNKKWLMGILGFGLLAGPALYAEDAVTSPQERRGERMERQGERRQAHGRCLEQK